MLEQPWAPQGSGPQQPRDAHRRHWTNDARVRPARPAATDLWGPDARREPAARRRGHDPRRQDHAGRGTHDAPAPVDEGRTCPLAARWVPAEEWIPDPTPAPDDRWTPERDWAVAFTAAGASASGAPEAGEPTTRAAEALRPGPRRWFAVTAAALVGVAVLALGVTLV